MKPGTVSHALPLALALVLLAACIRANPVPESAPPASPVDLQSQDSLITINESGFLAHKNLIWIVFKSGTPKSAKQAVINRIHGKVAGGSRMSDTFERYYVRIPNSFGVVKASDLAKQDRSVVGAAPIMLVPIR